MSYQIIILTQNRITFLLIDKGAYDVNPNNRLKIFGNYLKVKLQYHQNFTIIVLKIGPNLSFVKINRKKFMTDWQNTKI